MNPVTSAMTAELEQVLSIDEECRSRVAFAQKEIERAIEEARAARDQALDQRQKALSAAIERELLSIREEDERQMAVRRTALDEYLARLAAAGEQQREAAARIYARIISGEPLEARE